MRKRRRLRRGAVVFLAASAILPLGLLLHQAPEPSPDPGPDTGSPVEKRPDISDLARQLRQAYDHAHAVNGDTAAMLAFRSGLLQVPVMQGPDNDTYLHTDWQSGAYLSSGSVFLDYRNRLNEDDQNTIIYGHYVYETASKDRTLAFTPLSLLRDPAAGRKEQEILLVNEEEVRVYRLARIYDCPLVALSDGTKITAEDLEYNLIRYEPEGFEAYMKAIQENELYELEEPLRQQDHLLTLQTCIEGHSDSRQVLIAREIRRIRFADMDEGNS